jgi:hypothetical protein
MSNLGLGVMIQMMGGNQESAAAFTEALGKTISKMELTSDDELELFFTDETKLVISDQGQSCCESRYMRTDDNLEEYVGATLISGEVKEAPNMPDEYGEHEVQFLEIMTSKGPLTMSSHNEHNGYYGGFWIVARRG